MLQELFYIKQIGQIVLTW